MRQIYTGIVIKSIDYNASDRIITILSSDDSFVVFKARGVNKMNSPLMKYTIPFSISEFELESKGEMSNKTLVAANSVFYPRNINENIESIALFSYISESLNYIDSFKGLYDYVKDLIEAVESGKDVRWMFLNYLNYFIKCNGLSLCLDKCVSCGSKSHIVDVDYVAGGYLCSSCSINRKAMSYIESLYGLNRSKGVYLNDKLEDGDLFVIIKDLLSFLNDNSGIKIKSEKFLLNSLFNM